MYKHRWELDQALATADSSWRDPHDSVSRKHVTAFRELRHRLHEIFQAKR